MTRRGAGRRRGSGSSVVRGRGAGHGRRRNVLAAVAAALAVAAPAQAQETHFLVVAGLGGDATYGARFLEWATGLHEAAVERLGVAEGNVVILAEDADADPRVRARSTKENVEGAVAELATRAGPDDRVVVVLIGHGSQREGDPRFNLPGPDLTATDIDLLLGLLAPRRVALVNAASASGDFVPVVSGPGRTVLTATRSGRERNETRFGGFFVEAMGEEGADLDKDGRISLLEAFTYARAEVERHYGEQNLILTEHAMLDDDGDGRGSEEPSVEGGDGSLAATFYLGGALGASAAAAEASRTEETSDPELRALLRERAALEERLARLRSERDAMDGAAYDAALEEILVELALKDREIRERRGGGGG